MYVRQLQGDSTSPSYKEPLHGNTMDDGAFVESLFAPEMRPIVVGSSSLFPSLPTCGRVKALSNFVPTPPGSGNFIPPQPPNSLLGGGIVASSSYNLPFQAPNEETPQFVRINDEEMFGHMLHAQDFHDTQGKSATNNLALLLEPLELPRTTDTIMTKETLATSAATSNSTYGLDTTLMSNYPTTGQLYCQNYQFSTMATPHAWGQDTTSFHDTSTPQIIKQSVAQASVASSIMQHQPSPGSVDMYHPIVQSQPATSGIWLAMLNSNSPPQSTESLDRPSFSLTISPPASLTSNSLKELIVSADLETPSKASKRSRMECSSHSQEKATNLTKGRGKGFGKLAKGKKCVELDCMRRAQSNSRCKAHGGGARCQFTGPGGCNRSSQGGGFCRAHGGGKRCEFPGCTRGQQRKGRCYVHGGIRKCQFEKCEKKDRGNGFCIAHGGGKRCEHVGCSRAVRRGLLCQIHDVGNEERESLLM
ncbi:uncharacterized protein PHALS_11626 [Plasmopara halstedii]|uniref:WRKY19-like zinc finger domain-containing protein n=1 Tax=Plasmopara halstedii TaxID=4781 RepID=A0A0P1AKZ9_PLAHL|nr:uncharacterized protein PHALS_11626 [Plasmopara halstedii]CEG41268.1 hypothetical protein PHALS_11626 [Plasmopara halstedii]|eukprot:XP_024577637.1 hypothetical protein PHALS_11626 [Plasmopara halstedii]